MSLAGSTSFPFCFDWTIDDEGALWCAAQGGAVRLAAGGTITQRIELERPAFSVALGGPDGTTLSWWPTNGTAWTDRQGAAHWDRLHD